MKNQILLMLCLVASVFVDAQISISGPDPANCNIYSLDYTGFEYTPSYYPGDPAYPLGPGYSYFWYTSDGQSSTLKSPNFQFTTSSVTINLVVTPRKKPGHNKQSISQTFTGLTPNGCPINYNTNAKPWTDHTPRVDDTMYLVVPLNKCGNQNIYSGKVSSIQGMTFLDYFETPFITSLSESNGEVFFDLDWQILGQNRAEVVLKFLVTANDSEPVSCEVAPKSSTDGECNPSLVYNELAKGGPYDPNFLVPSLGRNMDDCNIGGDTIYYDLQFQNEGTGPTDLIYSFIKFDSKLDPSTLFLVNTHTATVPLVGTHWYRPHVIHNIPNSIRNLSSFLHQGVDYSGGQICGFKCDNLMLTPMSTNYDNSIGNIRCGIIVRPGVVLQPCEELISTAEVIFHPMPGVQTDGAVTSCKCPDTSVVDCSKCPETRDDENSFWCWVKCWHKWIIGIFLLLFLWCFWGKWRGARKK